MSLEPLLLLLGVWLVLNLLGAAGRKRQQSGRPQAKPGAVRKAPTRPRAPRLRTAASPGAARADPTQREGSRLEELLREFGLQLEEAGRGPMGRRSGVSLPDAEGVEEVESLEQEPEIESLETYGGRRERELVVQDDEAEAVVQRRLAWAEEQARPLTAADHQAFDRRIRAAPEALPGRAPTEAPSDRAARLRQAMVLREVLGPPTGLRVD